MAKKMSFIIKKTPCNSGGFVPHVGLNYLLIDSNQFVFENLALVMVFNSCPCFLVISSQAHHTFGQKFFRFYFSSGLDILGYQVFIKKRRMAK